MAATPPYKVYNRYGTYVAAFRDVADAIAFASTLVGEGSEVRKSHRLLLWHQGFEAFDGADSYDRAAAVALCRESGKRETSFGDIVIPALTKAEAKDLQDLGSFLRRRRDDAIAEDHRRSLN